MKKKILSVMVSFCILCSMVLNVTVSANAEDGVDPIVTVDGSRLTNEEYSHATSENPMLRSQYLMTGDSIIAKTGNRKIYTYGATTANFDVDYVAVVVYAQEYFEGESEEDSGWNHVDSRVAEARDTYYVASAKTVRVDGGHYYRVCCSHTGGNEDDRPFDETFSRTDGIWVP